MSLYQGVAPFLEKYDSGYRYWESHAVNTKAAPELVGEVTKFLDAGRPKEALAAYQNAEEADQNGVVWLQIGDGLREGDEIADAMAAYEAAARTAADPKTQFEVGLLLLERAGAAVDDILDCAPLDNHGSRISCEVVNQFHGKVRPLLRRREISIAALVASGRAYFGMHLSLLESDTEAILRVGALKALGVALAMLGDREGAAAVDWELSEWGVETDDIPSSVLFAAFAQPMAGSADAAAEIDAVVRRLTSELMPLNAESRRHLAVAEMHLGAAREGTRDAADDAVIRYARAFEAQVSEILSRLLDGERLPLNPDQDPFNCLMHWEASNSAKATRSLIVRKCGEHNVGQYEERGWEYTAAQGKLRTLRVSDYTAFLLFELPETWNGRERREGEAEAVPGLRVLRNRAAHGDPFENPVRFNDLLAMRTLLIGPIDENGGGVFQRLGKLRAELMEAWA